MDWKPVNRFISNQEHINMCMECISPMTGNTHISISIQGKE